MEFDGRDSSHPPISAEEEAVKRNTDCVYFLASPLTCKKGNECEYRHSEGARVNPRDCWYWLSGSCLNPKCLFRHPPLDGLIGAPSSTPPGPAQSAGPKNIVPGQVHAVQAPARSSTKQSVPCYYFQNGGCLKGSRCPFTHGGQPSPGSTKQAGQPAMPSSEPLHASKNLSWTSQRSAQQTKPEAAADKGLDLSRSSKKVDSKAEVPFANGLAVKSAGPPPPLTGDDHAFQPGNAVSRDSDYADRFHGGHLQPVDEHMQDGREPDDSLRESSPGFDVLVEEHEDAGYFQDDTELGGTPDYGRINLGLVSDIDYLHSSDYESLSRFEGEAYDGVAEFERYGQHNEYRQENKRSSERRGPMREDSHGKLDASDLRHRLLKQRKANRPRSAIIAAHRDEPHQESDRDVEQRHRSDSSRRDQRHLPRESSISKRLQGRIKLPERPDLDNYSSSRSERAADKGRSRGRSSSPGRPSSRQGRDHEITTQKAHKQDPGREEEAGPLNFAGPKSLAELKGMMTRNNGSAITQDRKISEADPSFERPKLPSAILKRKREEAPEAAMERPASRDRMTISSSGLENGDGLAEGPKSSPVEEEEEENTKLPNGQLDEETNPKEEDLAEWPLSEHPLPERQMLETEDGDFQEEDHELDDEDGDDFARKLGVMLS
ncbi:unnamed protein product [Spirodela intermedia]|uniref:C3H1-type domain-containing protein n=1 Tax=Spirodela intermedia TaxID=51605 RepID=A0A7I8L2C3_SPIIN|nr:unnamed protein product [Spirodela intermedia]